VTATISDTREVAASGSTPFIGRSAELELLCGAARGEGAPTAWLLGGEAGVGKTRLDEEVMHRVEAGESSIGRGSCLHMAQGALPFVAVAEALSALCAANDAALVGRLVDDMPELAIVLPDVVPAAGGSVGTAGDDAARLRLFDSIGRLLAQLSEIRPVCIVLEDLHWAEPSTRDLLAFLVAHLGEHRVAIIGSYRSDAMSRTHPLRPLLAELDRHPRVEHLTLAPFDTAELAAFADARLGEPPTARLLDDVAVRSGGNAFYAAELLDAFASGRRAVRRELFDLILARIEPLSADTKETLDLLAAGGGQVRDELIAAVTQKDEETLDAALHEAIEHQVVVVGDDGTLHFRHALMQEAVYSTLLPRQRRRTHERYAAALTEQPDLAASPASEAAELAWHLREARRFEEAFAASLAAADAAQRILAFSEALEHVELALELWDEARQIDGVAPSHVELLARAAALSASAGNAPRAVSFQRAALDEATASPPNGGRSCTARSAGTSSRRGWRATRSPSTAPEWHSSLATAIRPSAPRCWRASAGN
jgi:predicted ATPase